MTRTPARSRWPAAPTRCGPDPPPACQRRMCGTTRTARYWAGRLLHTYYKCTHDADNPKHAAAHPDHPRTVTSAKTPSYARPRLLRHPRLRPRPRRLARRADPGHDRPGRRQHARDRDRLAKELARIDLAQRPQITQIDTLDPDPANTAAQAMRHRCYERFAELQADRETAQAQLDTLNGPPLPATPPPAAGPNPPARRHDRPAPRTHPGRPLPGLRHPGPIQRRHEPGNPLRHHHHQHPPSRRGHPRRHRPRPPPPPAPSARSPRRTAPLTLWHNHLYDTFSTQIMNQPLSAVRQPPTP